MCRAVSSDDKGLRMLKQLLWGVVILGLTSPLFAARRSDGNRPRTPSVSAHQAGPGDLAIAATPAGPWRILRPSEPVPEQGFFRTSSAGVSRLRLPGANLYVAGESRGQFDSVGHSLSLTRGSVVLETENEWECLLPGEVRTVVAPASVAEAQVARPDTLRCAVLTGSLQFDASPGKGTFLPAGKSLTRRADSSEPEVAALDRPERERLRELVSPSAPPQGLGQLVIQDPQTGQPYRLNLARYHVNVVLQPPVALVQIDQSFYNPFAAAREGTFTFNLPEGASVSRFAMYTTPTTLIEGELIERAKASGIYQSIVDRQRDPAILEQVGSNLFRMRVFPILGRDSKRILLDFTIPLVEQTGGAYQFALPLLSDLEPVWDFRIGGSIRGDTLNGTVLSDSHPQTAFSTLDSANGLQTFEFKQKNYRPAGDFSLRFQQRPQRDVSVRTYFPDERFGAASEAEPYCHFLTTVRGDRLNPPPVDQASPPPADLLILADTSGGTRNFGRVDQAVRTLVHNLRPQDRFRLAAIDVSFRPLGNDWISARDPEIETALARFDLEFPLGELDLERSLAGAIESVGPPEPGRRKLVIYVGDGALATNRPQGESILQALLPQINPPPARMFALLLAADPQGQLLFEGLARGTGGRVWRTPRSLGMSQLLDWVLSGCPSPARLIAFQAEGVAADDLFAPPSWVPGETLFLMGRRKTPGGCRLQLAYERDGRERREEWSLDLKPDGHDVFVGRLWGQRKLEQLSARAPTTGPKAAIDSSRDQIISLSQEWTLLSPLTAFLVLERESEYAQYGITRRLRHQYWKPNEAVATEPLAWEVRRPLSQPRVLGPRPTIEQVEQVLLDAKEALDKRNPDRALSLLQSVAHVSTAADSPVFKQLQTDAIRALGRTEMLRQMGWHRGLFGRQGLLRLQSRPADLVLPMLQGMAAVDHSQQDQPAWHRQLVILPTDRMPLEDFVSWFGGIVGLNTWLDRQSLFDEGYPRDLKIDLRGIRSMSAKSLLTRTLRSENLVHYVEEDILKVTTVAKAGELLTTQVYRVGDLVHARQKIDPATLENPDYDFQQAAAKRIEDKLDRRVSINVNQQPLSMVLESLGERLEDNLIVERTAILDEGISLDTPVTLTLRDIPLRTILRHVCQPLQLGTVVEHEALVITSQAKAGAALTTRLHSVQGIVYQLSPEAFERQRALGWDSRGWGIGGRFGGMGGGGGGMGGGGFGGGGMGGSFGGGGAGGGMIGGGGGTGAGGMAGAGGVETTGGNAGEAGVSNTSVPGVVGGAGGSTPPSFSDTDSQFPDPDAAGAGGGPFGWTPFLLPNPNLDNAPDVTELLELMTSTIDPENWDEVGGAASVRFASCSLAMAVRATAPMQAQIEALFDRLRDTPDPIGLNSDFVPARIPIESNAQQAETMGFGDFTELIELVTSVVEPESWDQVGGAGSVRPYNPKLALTVRQTPAIHDSIRNLLTDLRRARYREQFGRPWIPVGAGNHLAGPPLGISELPIGIRQSELPEHKPEELKILAARRESPGAQDWRCTSFDGRPIWVTRFRRGEARTELECDGRLARLAGDDALVAYPGLTLVETGPWGEALRRVLDARLPWLPHRSNRELAQLFEVSAGVEDDLTVQIQLKLPAAGEGTHLQWTISKATGLPIRCESWLDGELRLRLELRDVGGPAGRQLMRTVDAYEFGKFVQRWELADARPDDVDIPDFASSWPSFARFISEEARLSRTTLPPLERALVSIRAKEWPAAEGALIQGLEQQPGQPLLAFLRAWTLAQRHGADHNQILAALQPVIADEPPADLAAILANGDFPLLSPDKILSLLQRQPVSRRTPADWDRLATAAIRAAKVPDAIQAVQSAIAGTRAASERFPREQLLVRLLAENNALPEAIQRALAWGQDGGAEPEEYLTIAEILHQHRAPQAGTLIERAVAAADRKKVAGDRRYALLRREAELKTGLTRWRTLLAAHRAATEGSPLRKRVEDLLLSELTEPIHVESTAILADETAEPRLQARLRLREARLYEELNNDSSAANIGWTLFQARQLPEKSFDWLCGRLAAARQQERLIEALEGKLRAREPVSRRHLALLETAYEAVSRPQDAARARSQPRR
ncbi:MAG: VIT domain-containing protein [Planctomycetales bacterium]